jgi:hypothetical protein
MSKARQHLWKSTMTWCAEWAHVAAVIEPGS